MRFLGFRGSGIWVWGLGLCVLVEVSGCMVLGFRVWGIG